MRVVVNDTSCLVDLRKAGLLQAALLLPFHFQIPLPLIHAELLDFSVAEVTDLTARGLTVIDLPPEQVAHALTMKSAYASLSIYDCMNMALAMSQPDCILLTADQSLRRRAQTSGIEVHGALWVMDRLEAAGRTAYQELHDALKRLEADPFVYLPKDELAARIARLKLLLRRA
jgi:predicted nucleic acid-binding protein